MMPARDLSRHPLFGRLNALERVGSCSKRALCRVRFVARARQAGVSGRAGVGRERLCPRRPSLREVSRGADRCPSGR